jgi:hypothetical protein
MPDTHVDEIPEFAHVNRDARRRELTSAGASAHQQLDAIKKRLKLPGLVSVQTDVKPINEAALLPNGCPERVRVLRLLAGPNQQLLKEIDEQWNDGTNCYRTIYTVGSQFTGYGAYCMSFEKDPGNTGLFTNFFRDIAAYGVNLHRTFVFINEDYENKTPANLQRLLLDGDGKTTSPDQNYLANLERMVVAAKASGVVIEVCLFIHHAVVYAPNATPPKPVAVPGNSPYERYRAFFNKASLFLPMQGNLIDGVVRRLLPHWNVIYEIGNELRVPTPVLPAYGEQQLKDWIDWAATRIRASDTGHLISTSCGIENEAPINQLQRIQFCTFHQGQWSSNMDAACDRARAYGNKHVIFDDDGGARPLTSVQAWSKAALNVRDGCRVSYNHKGPAPVNAYDPQWVTTPGLPGQGRAIDVLDALRQARATSMSPCAGN